MELYEILMAIFGGLLVIIPLMMKLWKFIKTAVKSKNWSQLMKLVIDLMTEAEEKFSNGADRREWVLSMVEAGANAINCEVDLEQIGALIDAICKMAKIVNAQKKEE
jgi:hypothetical protein